MASVHIGSGWGHVGLQRDKSSASSLVSLQDMLVRLKADSKGIATRKQAKEQPELLDNTLER